MASSSWKPFVTFSICFPKSSVHIHHTLGSVAVHLNSPPRCLLKQNLFHLLPNYWWTLFLFTPEWSTPTRSLHTSLKLIHTHINTRALGLVCVLVNIVFTFRVTTLQQGCVSVNVCAVCVCVVLPVCGRSLVSINVHISLVRSPCPICSDLLSLFTGH